MASPEELLSRSQRNDLFRMLEKPGAPVSEFRLQAGSFGNQGSGIGNLQGVYIRHDASGSFFFIQGSGMYSISGSIRTGDPAMNVAQGAKAFTEALELEPKRARSASLLGRVLAATKGMMMGDLPWDQVLSLVEKWAYEVIDGFQAYDDTPDLWAELDESRQLLSASSDNTPFTDDEQA